MRYPDFLQANGTVGFVAPAFGCDTEPYKSAFFNAQKKIKAMGYALYFGPNCQVGCGIGISNQPMLCARELMEAYLHSDADVLISCGGGEMMCEVIPYIDFDVIAKASPKWFMGYSDNTNFTFLSAILADTAAIYGPCAPTFGMEPWHEAISDAWQILTGRVGSVHGYPLWEKEGLRNVENPYLPYHVTEPAVYRAFLCGNHVAVEGPQEIIHIKGRLIGGNLDCLVNLTGTPYDKVRAFNERYQEDSMIWFLEACELNVMDIRRAIWHLKEAGWFEHVAGFLIGRPGCMGEEAFGCNQYTAVTDLLAEFGVPILMDLDIGHLPPMMPLITGAIVQVDYRAGEFRMEYCLE